MAFGTLYSYEGNQRTIALLAVAKANNLELDFVSVKAHDETIASKNPFGKIPAFVGADGYTLHETNAIAIYFTSQNAETTLLGKTKEDYAKILQWLSVANTEVLPKIAAWFKPLAGMLPYNKKTVEDAEKEAEKTLSVLENTLAKHTFLVGHRITLADLVLAAHLDAGFCRVFGTAWRSAHPNITRYYETIANQPIYKAVAGVNFIDEAIKPPVQKKEEKPKKEEKKAEKPKVESKKAAKKADKDDDEEEPLVPAEPKAKHPLDAASTGSLVLDEWKRTYSNEDTRKTALPWFWEHLDKEAYSLWRVDYKYNDELTLTFMSSNLIGGFFSRLEASRKYIFGSMSVYGESNNSVISGAFVVRGKDAVPAFDVAPDFESYEFTPLDAEKDKAFIEAQWAWDEPLVKDGKTYEHADGKVFK